MTALTKKEFLAKVQATSVLAGYSFGQQIYRVVFGIICHTITKALSEGRSVCLPGIGTLKPVTLPPLERFCALTGKMETSPARRSVKFRPSTMVKRELNKEGKK